MALSIPFSSGKNEFSPSARVCVCGWCCERASACKQGFFLITAQTTDPFVSTIQNGEVGKINSFLCHNERQLNKYKFLKPISLVPQWTSAPCLSSSAQSLAHFSFSRCVSWKRVVGVFPLSVGPAQKKAGELLKVCRWKQCATWRAYLFFPWRCRLRYMYSHSDVEMDGWMHDDVAHCAHRAWKRAQLPLTQRRTPIQIPNSTQNRN